VNTTQYALSFIPPREVGASIYEPIEGMVQKRMRPYSGPHIAEVPPYESPHKHWLAPLTSTARRIKPFTIRLGKPTIAETDGERTFYRVQLPVEGNEIIRIHIALMNSLEIFVPAVNRNPEVRENYRPHITVVRSNRVNRDYMVEICAALCQSLTYPIQFQAREVFLCIREGNSPFRVERSLPFWGD
jgi:hypothetical protein